MCGFVGGNLRNVDYAAAAEVIRHRGPDDHHIWSDGQITLAFRRLSIIDLDRRSAQPMWHQAADVSLVFNGEIYGFQLLRKELERLGHVFRTQSDTEVVLNAYVEWGDSFVDRLDGMFAIAIYDRRNNTIRLWRDRVGIKPLYYYWDGKRFAFASEIKALAALLPEKLDPKQAHACGEKPHKTSEKHENLREFPGLILVHETEEPTRTRRFSSEGQYRPRTQETQASHRGSSSSTRNGASGETGIHRKQR